MRIMYCHFNMFDMYSQVLAIEDDKEPWPLFTGTFDDVCSYMATEYQTHNYEKILLAGPYAEAVQDRVITYSKSKYNYEDINIEVLK